MKTMTEMQLEMIERADIQRKKTGSEYPKEIWLNAGLMPVLALAKNSEQEKELLRQNEITPLIYAVGLLSTVVVIILFLIFGCSQ